MTVDEYLAWSKNQSERQRTELINGQIITMPSERVRHSRIKGSVHLALLQAVKAANLPCEALPDGQAVRIDEHTAYEPDALVYCGDMAEPDALLIANPVIVVEVLLPGTRSVDLGGKFADYFKVPTIHHYLIVRTQRREVIHHSRSGPDVVSRVINIGSIMLHPPGINIDLADICPADG